MFLGDPDLGYGQSSSGISAAPGERSSHGPAERAARGLTGVDRGSRRRGHTTSGQLRKPPARIPEQAVRVHRRRGTRRGQCAAGDRAPRASYGVAGASGRTIPDAWHERCDGPSASAATRAPRALGRARASSPGAASARSWSGSTKSWPAAGSGARCWRSPSQLTARTPQRPDAGERAEHEHQASDRHRGSEPTHRRASRTERLGYPGAQPGHHRRGAKAVRGMNQRSRLSTRYQDRVGRCAGLARAAVSPLAADPEELIVRPARRRGAPPGRAPDPAGLDALPVPTELAAPADPPLDALVPPPAARASAAPAATEPPRLPAPNDCAARRRGAPTPSGIA